MFIKKTAVIKIFLLTALLFIFFTKSDLKFNRYIGYESIPSTTDIYDELNYIHAGYSFRQTGIPTAWSNLGCYLKSPGKTKQIFGFDGINIRVNGQVPNIINAKKYNYPFSVVKEIDRGKGQEHILFVQPFLDHPILGSLIYSLGIKEKYESFEQFKSEDYRAVALTISLVSGFLIFILTFLLTNEVLPSFFAFIIYSIAPSFILSSRFALLENILIPISLANLIFLFLSQKVRSKRQQEAFIILAGVFSGLALMVKELGIFLLIANLYILVSSRAKIKKIIYFLTPTVILGSSFYVYAFWLSPTLFNDLFFSQTSREFFGPLNLLVITKGLNFNNFPVDGFWLWGIISTAFIKLKKRIKLNYVFVAAGSYLLTLLFFGGANYPWYYLPFIPFFSIAAGYELYKFIKSPTIISLIVFFTLPFSTALYWGYFSLNPEKNQIALYRFCIALFVIIFGIYRQRVKISDFVFKIAKNRIKLLTKPVYLSKALSFLWFTFVAVFLLKTYQWSTRAILFIIENWGNLPETFTLKQF
ncbi:MAG TPA: phospholipid carrier-dependent glycosyltransferase [Patescibacteria group bacterium]|nr:phospholipid carrier-dependent glycosyltransferase [Patescibacteria group bacterium]